ncbi:MAG: ribonuclease P protein component [Bacteroidota bacterium]
MLKPLQGQKNFADVFSSGKRFFEKDAVAIVCFRDLYESEGNMESGNITEPVTLFAVKITKKIEKKAVVRNRIKRLMREGLKKSYSDLASFELNVKIDKLIINWRVSPGKSGLIRLEQVQTVIRKLLIKVNEYKIQNSEKKLN